MVYLLFYQQEVILPHSNKLVKILGYSLTASTASCIDMSDVHQDFMREWAGNNGKTEQQRSVTEETTKYESGTLPLNMYQTEEQIGEQLPFDGASEEREKAIEGDKYSDESGTDPDGYLNDDELPRQNLSFLRTTRSGCNISFNKKYGV